ncbi:hypothetical protein BHM03_00051767 [Ensete ventricosum]|nr:hypothetical protein BHM03_00051767 [Ensete ventricosum]
MAGAPDLGRSSVSRTGASTELPREPLGSMITEDGLHKGLVRMGVHDVTPPTLQSVFRPCFRSDSVPPWMPMWRWRRSFSDSDADVAAELVLAPMGWVGPFSCLSEGDPKYICGSHYRSFEG